MNRSLRINTTIYFVLLAMGIVLAALSVQAGYRLVPTAYYQAVRTITDVNCQIALEPSAALSLPTKLSGLAPRTTVTVTTEFTAQPGDSLLVKSVFAPLQLYINDVLIGEFGQPGTYPAYLNDPPTLLTTIALPASNSGTLQLKAVLQSPSQRDTLVLPVITVGAESALIAGLVEQEGLSLLFALILLIAGMALVLIAVIFVRKSAPGSALLWLGLFSLSSGVWVMGECDLTALLLPYPTLLYMMAYGGLFSLTIPILRFGLVMIRPTDPRLLHLLLWVHVASLIIAVGLKLSGTIDFIRSLYWFHVIAPLAFVLFAANLWWERRHHANLAARRILPAIALLAGSAVLELLNYWLRFTPALTFYFQLGLLTFVFSLIVISGYYLMESLQAIRDKNQLEYEMNAINRQLILQRQQYQQLTESDRLVREQRHDLRHQLTVIRALSTQPVKLEQYITGLLAKVPAERQLKLCENYAVNAVAAHYFGLAQEAEIKITLQLTIPEVTEQVPASDLCIIVGNILENAIEACKRLPSDEPRFIRMTSRLHYNLLIITADNSFDGSIYQQDDCLLSTKRTGPGTGLSSIMAVAKKYGGTAKFEPTGKVFLSSVYLQLIVDE